MQYKPTLAYVHSPQTRLLQLAHRQDSLEANWKTAVVAEGGCSLTVQTGVYESDLYSFWKTANILLH